jgi:ribosomal protein L44E
MKWAHWKCMKCGDDSARVNTEHALWRMGKWKVGAIIRTLCSTCQKVTKHEIVEYEDGEKK